MKDETVKLTMFDTLTQFDIVVLGLFGVVLLLILLVLVKISQLRKISKEQEENVELIARRIEFSTFGGNKKLDDQELK